MLTVSELRKDFAAVRAVDGVSFQVRRGEIFGLLGPNGAGKSTTIRMILRILLPDAGTVLYDGRPFSDRVRNVLGYLPEERGLYRKSKLLDAVLYFAELRGMERGAARAAAFAWLGRFGLLDAAGRRVEELSKGNQQKVQFITAVLHDPALVILDEPFSGLDPVNQILFKDIFLELKQRGKAVVFSTHQMEQAEKLCDQICLINRGTVVLEGSLRDVKRSRGANTVHLGFDGDGGFLQSLPGVRRVILYGNSAELELEDGASPRALLAAAVERMDVRRFEVQEPSLQSIFLQTVGGAPAVLPGGAEA
jgi:ABC-2 type transport system ATP-binding protein